MVVATHKRKKYTYEDYAALPEGAPYQLIGGELIILPAPTPYHQKVCGKISYFLRDHVYKEKLGEVFDAPIDVFFEETETYQPDIIFISKERVGIVGEKRIEGAPDLVIEVISPATAYYDLRKKFRVYERHGVKEYWIVDPEEKSIEVYINQGKKFLPAETAIKKGTVESQILKGFKVQVEEIF